MTRLNAKSGVRTWTVTIALLFVGILIAAAGMAYAGAPGFHDQDASSLRLEPSTHDIQPDLSPAEIRNAVSIRMDSLAEQGIPVDRAAVDGIGLEVDERTAQASDF